MPTLAQTYQPGAALDLYAWPLPALPTSTLRIAQAPPIPTQISERYNRSIAERVTLPSTSPTVSITLEKRLESSMGRVPHVWTASVRENSSPSAAYPPRLVAKIFDPVFFDDDETEWHDPFYVRDITLPFEVEAYKRLGPVQGTAVPRFYGYFAAALPAQHCRTVYIILLEEVPGKDVRAIVPPDFAENVCGKHTEAIVDTVLHLFFDVLACGVKQLDMRPRNIILRPQKHVLLSAARRRFCDSEECILAHEVDCDDLHMVMVDFELVEFKEPNSSLSDQAVQEVRVNRVKPVYLKKWLENAIL